MTTFRRWIWILLLAIIGAFEFVLLLPTAAVYSNRIWIPPWYSRWFNLRSPWDTLHHGRDWAHRAPSMKDARAPERIVEDIARHLAKYPPLGSIDEILLRFLDEMRAVS